MTALSAALRTELVSLADTVAFSGDDAYAVLAMPWNVAMPSTPLAAVAPADAAAVARVVAFASANRIPVAVQATGHGAFAPVSG